LFVLNININFVLSDLHTKDANILIHRHYYASGYADVRIFVLVCRSENY